MLCRLALLIDDLSKYLSEVIVLPFIAKGAMPDTKSQKNPLRGQGEVDSDDEEDYRRSSSIMKSNPDSEGIEMRESKVIPDRKSCDAYINARQLTMRLVYVSLLHLFLSFSSGWLNSVVPPLLVTVGEYGFNPPTRQSHRLVNEVIQCNVYACEYRISIRNESHY